MSKVDDYLEKVERNYIVNLYYMRDKISKNGSPVFEAENDATAIRIFKSQFRVDFNKFKPDVADYELIALGELDKTLGRIYLDAENNAEIILKGSDL